MTRLKEKYLKEIVPILREEFGIKNLLAVPRLVKIVLNVGAADIKDNQAILGKVMESVGLLAGQKGVPTNAKKSISGFKVSKGQTIGVMTTLRGERMYEFLDKLISIVLPKVRDFRGIPRQSFDGQGNYNLGMSEMAIFSEVGFENAAPGGRTRGLSVSIVTSSRTKEQAVRFLELLGMPFRKENKNG